MLSLNNYRDNKRDNEYYFRQSFFDTTGSKGETHSIDCAAWEVEHSTLFCTYYLCIGTGG